MSSNPDDSVPNALREVWGWKESLQREFEGKTTEEMMRIIHERAEELLRSRGIVLPRVGGEGRNPDLDRATG